MKQFLLICLLVAAAPLYSAERILDFDSDIRVESNGTVEATETITVRAEGKQIRRGIYRDIPTEYQGHYGNRISVPLEVISVSRDGEPIAWQTESLSNGIRIYMGDMDVFLEPGVYRYQLAYKTERQIGFFDDFDEIYWNATGNNWAFPIRTAGATVFLPQPVAKADLRLAVYTGPAGSKAHAATIAVPEPGVVQFRTTQPLAPREGLTIAVGFPKGIVAEPTRREKAAAMVQDNRGLLGAFIALVLALIWYLYAWNRVGRDPQAGVIYARYEPPEGYSPASLRYVRQMGFDPSCLAAALVNLAVRDAITITRNDDDEYIVTKQQSNPKLESRTEKKLFDALFKDAESVHFKQENHDRIGEIVKAHEAALSTAYEGHYFQLNRGWLVGGTIITLFGLIGLVWAQQGENRFIAGFLSLWLAFWTIFSMYLVISLYRKWRDLRGWVDSVAFVVRAVITGFFVIAEITALGVFAALLGWLSGLLVFALLVLNGIFYQLMKAPTVKGRKLLDKIEGLRLYLGVAERQSIETRHGKEPPKTLAKFETLLAYAIALDAAETWAEKFAGEIKQAEQAGELQHRSWYAAGTTHGGFNAGSLAAGLGSGFAGAIASSASAPGSSSGSGGGGFSGGGGGGGGGGGF